MAQTSPKFSVPTVFTTRTEEIRQTKIKASGSYCCLLDFREAAVHRLARKPGVTFDILLQGDADCIFTVGQLYQALQQNVTMMSVGVTNKCPYCDSRRSRLNWQNVKKMPAGQLTTTWPQYDVGSLQIYRVCIYMSSRTYHWCLLA